MEQYQSMISINGIWVNTRFSQAALLKAEGGGLANVIAFDRVYMRLSMQGDKDSFCRCLGFKKTARIKSAGVLMQPLPFRKILYKTAIAVVTDPCVSFAGKSFFSVSFQFPVVSLVSISQVVKLPLMGRIFAVAICKKSKSPALAH